MKGERKIMCMGCEEKEAKQEQIHTKLCKICGVEKPLNEFLFDGENYRAECKVCNYLKRHKELRIKRKWTIEEYKTILDSILNNRYKAINNIVVLLDNKTLNDLIDLLKTDLKIGNFKHSIQVEKICPNCNENFFVTLSKTNAVCCSRDCSSQYKKASNSILVKCDNCGKELLRTRSGIEKGNHNFCNLKCRDEYNKEQYEIIRLQNLEIRKCEYCNEEFECDKNSTQRFCSQKCVHKWYGETYKGENSQNYNSVECNCSYCNKKIKVTQSKYDKFNEHFCNKECYQHWFNNIYSQTIEFREKSRKIALSNLKNRRFKTDSGIQHKVNNILEELKIEYENEKIFGNYSIDNYLINENLAIEVNGDYFHTNPNKYKEIYYENQLNKIYTDKTKNTYLKKYENINILYLWENDISNTKLCIKLLKKYIQNKGKLKDYNSFNYHLDDNNSLKLNKILIKSYIKYTKEELDSIVNLQLKMNRQEKMRNKDKWVSYKCDMCGVELTQLKSVYEKNENHFCSYECRDVFKRVKITKTCDNCGEELEVLPSRLKKNKHFFCNKSCEIKFRKKQPKKQISAICETCGITYLQKEYDYNKSNHHFCSQQCKNEFQKTSVEVNCSNCGKEILRTPSSLKRKTTDNLFCSKECESKFKINNKNPDKWIEYDCEICGAKVNQKKSAYIKSKHHYCSDKCSGLAKNKQVTFECDNCGKDKTVKLSKYNQSKNHFCCYECSVEYKRKNK